LVTGEEEFELVEGLDEVGREGMLLFQLSSLLPRKLAKLYVGILCEAKRVL